MKKILLFVLVSLLFKISGYTQDYLPFLSDSVLWTETNFFETGYATIYGWISKTEEDTVFEGKKYKKLFKCDFCEPDRITPEFFYLIREDTIARKVYLRQLTFDGIVEEVLYDFSLIPGDSICYISFYGSWCMTLDSIKNIEYMGISRRTFYFENGITWIEGIGSTRGPIFSANILTCVFKDTVHVFESDMAREYGTCYIFTGIEVKESISPVSVYPIPFKNELTIDFIVNTNENWKFCMYNIMGKMVYSVSYPPGGGKKLFLDNLGYLPPGMYILKGTNGRREFARRIYKVDR